MKPLAATTIRYLLFSIGATVLLQLGQMMVVKRIDWWELGAAVLPQIAAIFVRMAQPDVQAPAALNTLSLGLLNKGNPT